MHVENLEESPEKKYWWVSDRWHSVSLFSVSLAPVKHDACPTFAAMENSLTELCKDVALTTPVLKHGEYVNKLLEDFSCRQ